VEGVLLAVPYICSSYYPYNFLFSHKLLFRKTETIYTINSVGYIRGEQKMTDNKTIVSETPKKNGMSVQISAVESGRSLNVIITFESAKDRRKILSLLKKNNYRDIPAKLTIEAVA